MPGPDVTAGPPVPALDEGARTRLRALLERPGGDVDFPQVVRLLELLDPGARPVGGFEAPNDEVARFGAAASLAFPATEVRALELRDGAPARVEVTFLGLTGPSGALPTPYTEQVIDRVAARDTGLRDFLDIFNHRLLSLFYRAWRKTRPGGAGPGGGAGWLTTLLRDIVGLGTSRLHDRLPLPDAALVYYAGLLGPRPRSAAALRQLLADFFGVPVEVEQFIGGWYPLAPGTQCALGDESAPALLGESVLVGDEAYDVQARARVRIGPLAGARYAEFLPSGGAHRPLCALLELFDPDVEFEIQLVLARDAVPRIVLGDGDAPSLGWTTWLRPRPLEHDADDTVLRP
jgi:type VI secretion system protein ImpH